MMFDIPEFFRLGMKRDLNALIQPCPKEIMLNLGSGLSPIDHCLNLDLPNWDGDRDPIPAATGYVDTIFAFHFLEHLKEPIKMLKEIERVLKIGGTVNIVVPHRLGQIAYQDLDHKHFFTDETWKTLFNNQYYIKNQPTPWQFCVNFNMIMGLNERNLVLLTQLVKVS